MTLADVPAAAPVPATAADAAPPASRPDPRDVAAITAVLAHVEGLTREEAAARIATALARGDRHLDLLDG